MKIYLLRRSCETLDFKELFWRLSIPRQIWDGRNRRQVDLHQSLKPKHLKEKKQSEKRPSTMLVKCLCKEVCWRTWLEVGLDWICMYSSGSNCLAKIVDLVRPLRLFCWTQGLDSQDRQSNPIQYNGPRGFNSYKASSSLKFSALPTPNSSSCYNGQVILKNPQ